ncbi:phage major capsid protein [Tropicimonas sp. IMCC34043]|uniref:phage major capsid protein n=1 Tax=Tropicimonas sp. IMCC34043 TaxID=2248760 RepID=UPI000E249D63|nr:phage major capsid protein [Tropicimonas sp. IMCC34043]
MTFQVAARAFRAGEIVRAGPEDDLIRDDPSSEVEISFSSEAPVSRFDWHSGKDYAEVLGHRDGEVDLARCNAGTAPLLKDHDARLDSQIGKVVRAWLDGGKGRAIVRFSDTPSAKDVLARVRAGDVSCVSVGYHITQAVRDGEADGLPVIRATRWAPFEISFVAVPADLSVGYGRSDGGTGETLTISENSREETDMPKDVETGAEGTETRTVPAAPKSDPAADLQRALADDRTRAAEIDAMGTRFNVPAEKIAKAKSDGMSVDAFRGVVLDYMGSPDAEATRAGATMIGLTDKQTRDFSLVRLLRHLATPDSREFRKAAGFEIEAVAAATETHKGQVRGVVIPADVTHASLKRASDQIVGTPGVTAAGGAVVDTTLLSGNMIDILRNTGVLSKLGTRVFAGLTGDVAFPKQLSDVTAYWIGEDGGPTQSGITFGQVKMTPHTVAALNEISRKLLIQDSVDVEAYVRASIMAKIALAVDNAGLNADADPDAPTGLGAVFAAGGSAIGHVDLNTAGQPTYKETVQMRTKVKKANALQGTLAYAVSPDVEEHLLTTPKFAGGELPIMLNEGNLGGYRAECSNQVNPADLWFGNWADLYMGLWSGVDILVDPYTNSASGAVRIVAHQDVDFAVAREASFCIGRDVA